MGNKRNTLAVNRVGVNQSHLVEPLLLAISEATNDLLKENNYLDAVVIGFERLGKALDVDRIYLFENELKETISSSYTSQRIEWVRQGIQAEIDNQELQCIPLGDVQDFVDPLLNESAFQAIVAFMANSPTRELLYAQGIKSILVLPVMVNGTFWGFVGFDDCRNDRTWPDTFLAVLKTYCASLARAVELEGVKQNLIAINIELEEKVRQRTDELNESHKALLSAQAEMVKREQLATIGQLLGGIAHELNTPLAAINASASNMRSSLLDLFKKKIPEAGLDELMYACAKADSIDLNNRLSTREERQLVVEFSEYIRTKHPSTPNSAYLSMLLAECAVKPNDIDTLEGILSASDPISRIELLACMMRIRRGVMTMYTASQKAAHVVSAIKTYIHSGTSEKVSVNLHNSIDAVLTLYQNLLRKGITEEIDVNFSFNVLGVPAELSQVWSNLIQNAIDAMNGKGKLSIAATKSEGCVTVTFTNTGPEIDEGILGRIFEPMFTTKPPGVGTGLGLNIITKILESHSGSIQVHSSSISTTFSVILPSA